MLQNSLRFTDFMFDDLDSGCKQLVVLRPFNYVTSPSLNSTKQFRMVNDGLQPWFSDRKKFGLRGMKTRDSVASEEGLAAVNTILNAKHKYLWSAALVYCRY